MKYVGRSIGQVVAEVGLVEIEGGLPHSLSERDTVIEIDTTNALDNGAIVLDRENGNMEIIDYRVAEGKLLIGRGKTAAGARPHAKGARMEVIEQLTPKEVRGVALKEYLQRTI